eukprot:TRINITY_DN9164_c0_g1_i1.p1 TRINITY_DN9164_c0_g1~~TRINITY_DN9164_c0_g1_i1.p1  ORF type:complete len:211 (-),score=43.71 TRINITY_DN9164_c0_g1_i1:208-840(-)
MVRSSSCPKVVHDTSSVYARRSYSGASAIERSNFMSSNLRDMYRKPKSAESVDQLGYEDEELDIRKILKDVEYLGSSHMTWKERKELENRNVVRLGGKPPKKQRLPLSVAKVTMKKRQQREQKALEEDLVTGRYGKYANNKAEKKRKAEDRVLKASEGIFRKGVLNVKHLLQPTPSRDDENMHKVSKGKKKGSGKRKKGNKRQGGKKHRR